MARNTAPTPQAALPSVRKSARWNSRIIEKWRGRSMERLERDGVGFVPVDILAALKGRDSYGWSGKQALLRASAGSCFDGVAGNRDRPLVLRTPPQAAAACPAAVVLGAIARDRITFAAWVSACSSWPQARHRKVSCHSRFPSSSKPHVRQVRLVYAASTRIRRPPRQASLYSSCRRNSLQPWSRIARLRRLLALTLRPGLSTFPLADFDRLATRRSSSATTECSAAMRVDSWCSQS